MRISTSATWIFLVAVALLTAQTTSASKLSSGESSTQSSEDSSQRSSGSTDTTPSPSRAQTGNGRPLKHLLVNVSGLATAGLQPLLLLLDPDGSVSDDDDAEIEIPPGVYSVESPPQSREGFGEPLSGLTDKQLARFEAGKEAFEHEFTPATGLGPVFNGQSCAECHGEPATGGASTIKGTRFRNLGSLNFAVGLVTQGSGSPHVQSRSVADEFPEQVPGCDLAPETVPDNALAQTQRVTPPLFGFGLLEAIPDSTLRKNGRQSARSESSITGRPGILLPGGINDLSQLGRLVGRIGARGFVADIFSFTQGAYRTEMGISTPHPILSLPIRPHGRATPPECRPFRGTAVPLAEVRQTVDFQRLLAPPPRGPITAEVERGEEVFSQLNCTGCHTPTLQTGNHRIEALANREVPLYSDLLLHDMGEALADRAPEGLGTNREWRTTPLWGVGGVPKQLIHDGRAGRNFTKAIELHGGEAAPSRERFHRLSTDDQKALIRFLESL